MEFREFYRGVCAKIRFDYHTGTYIGELDGVPAASFVQAGTYEGIKISLKQAVEDHLSGQATNAEDEWARVVQLQQAKVEKETEVSESDPFERRKFLR